MNYEILYFFILILVSTLNPISIFAADRIGNGGGVWACQISPNQYTDLMFMDVFEARREYQLTLPETNLNYLAYFNEKRIWIQNQLPQFKIKLHLDYVEKNMTWIDDIINTIPDAANKISPHPSTCKNGEWMAVQLVNFTDDMRILVRKELFDSSLLTEMERSAVLIHEAIYSFLRSEYNDQNSVRARAITGFILSNLDDEIKVEKILNVIKNQKPIDPVDPSPNQGWVCSLKPDRYQNLFIFEHKNKSTAADEVFKLCTKDNNLPIDFPIIIPSPPNNCKKDLIYCEEFKSLVKNKRCKYTDFFGKELYQSLEKTFLDAKKDIIRQCMLNSSNEHECYNLERVSCW